MAWTTGLELYVRNYFDDPIFVSGGFMTTFTPYEQIFSIATTQDSITITGTTPQQSYPIFVYKNGIRLVNGTSYTIDNSGLIFTFNQSLLNGDVVVVDYWG